MRDRLAVVGAGCVISGDLDVPIVDGADTIIADDGIIAAVGARTQLESEIASATLVVDAVGTTVAPGLIDSHCHVVLGDYTPRQQTVGFLESYVHGGITSVVSPGEIHAPGRPHDSTGVKALAVAARACFLNFHPGGMRVHAGAVVLEPCLDEQDFRELHGAGVFLAKFGFGLYDDPLDGLKQVRLAQKHRIIVMCHSGGASIAGSIPITADHLLKLSPDVCGHINGGPTSLDEPGVDRIIEDSQMILQIVQAGNLRSAVRILEKVASLDHLDRIVIGSDTPTGTGVMPLGVLKTVAELTSFTGIDPALIWAMATGNSRRVWKLPAGLIKVGAPADLVVMDTPWGSRADDALGALALGDIPGISAVICAGVVRGAVSRNTPRATRLARIDSANFDLDAVVR